MTKRLLKLACIAVAAAAAIIASAMIFLNTRTERAAEMADLQAMRAAESVARLTWKDKLPDQPEEYWYDGANYALIPATEPKPARYGQGTERAGGAVKAFRDETGKAYPYDETRNYFGGILRVTVSSRDGALRVDMDWVQSEAGSNAR